MNQKQLDDAGESFIKNFESLRLSPYLDVAGVPTIGWGHTNDVNLDMGIISLEQAEMFFEEDIAQAERAVNQVTTDLSQNEFNALVSFVYNIGSHKFMHSTLFDKLNLGDKRGAAKEFKRWIYYHDPSTNTLVVSSDLSDRRTLEAALFTAI